MAVALNSSQVQQNFGAALDRALRGEDVIIERYGTPRAAIVEYARYEKLVVAERRMAQAHIEHASETDLMQSGQLNEAVVPYVADRDHEQVSARARQEHPIPIGSREAAGPGYRYVVRSPGICGGQPMLQGTRIPVKAVVGYYKLGMSVDEILAGLPHTTPAQIHEALSYYHDHVDEIEREIRENQLERLIERYGLQVAADGRITLAS